MKTTLQLKLLPSITQHALLLDTMHVFNAACTWIAAYAYAEQCTSKFLLQKALYQEVRQRFGLSAQLAIRAIAKAVEASKRDKATPVAFRPDGAVVYDERILSFQGLECASLMTLQGRVIVPMQMGAYQRVQFSRGHGQADLVLVHGQFFLLLTIDTPEAPPMEPTHFLGVDLGIVQLATELRWARLHGCCGGACARALRKSTADLPGHWHHICPAATQEAVRHRIPVSSLGQSCDLQTPCCPRHRHEGRACAGRLDAHPQPDDGSQRPAQQA